MFRRVLFLGFSLLLGVLIGEVLLGYGLWVKSQRQSAIGYALGQVRDIVGSSSPPAPWEGMRVVYRPQSLYAPDADLGYAARPGVYQVEIVDDHRGRRHRFGVTVDAAGHRATATDPTVYAGRPEIWVFGDSFVFGWGNEDWTTMPFFLQRYLPGRRVVNFAMNGYGNVHAYLQLRRALLEATANPEVVVVAYADYFNERNVASPSRLKEFRRGGASDTGFRSARDVVPPFTHPRARLVNGSLVVDRVPLFGDDGEASTATDPGEHEQYAVSRRLLTEMRGWGAQRKILMVLAYLRGADDDPVVEAAGEDGWVVADLRADAKRWEWDHFLPFDPHPGPRAQSTYAWKLFRTLRDVESRRPEGDEAPALP